MDFSLQSDARHIRIGVMALAVVAGLAALIVALQSWEWRPHMRVTIYFSEVGGLREGAVIQVAGHEIGKVAAISLVPGHGLTKEHPLYDVNGGVAVYVEVRERHADMVAINDEYFIAARGLFGERYIEVGPPLEGAARERSLQSGDVLRGVDPPNLDRALIRAENNIRVFREFGEAIEPELDALVAQLEVMVGHVEAIVPDGGEWAVIKGNLVAFRREASAFWQAWRSSGIDVAELGRLRDRARALAGRADAVLAEVRAELAKARADIDRLAAALPPDMGERMRVAMEKARVAMGQAEGMLGKVTELMDYVQRGNGSLGALLYDPEFPEDAKQLGRILKRQPWRIMGRNRPEGVTED